MQTEFGELLQGERPLFLHALNLPAGLRVLVLAPHPDDFDQIAMTLRGLRDHGNSIELVVLTPSSSGVEDGFRPGLTPAGKAAIREEEQRASCQFFGLPEDRLTFLRLDEDSGGDLLMSGQNLSRLTAYWIAHPADLVFLPHASDTNASHRRTYAMFRQMMAVASRPVIACLNRDPKTLAMREDLYALFGAPKAEWKAQLLRFHQTQHQRNLRTRGYGIDERILRVNREVANRLGKDGEYAEAFELEVF